MLLKPLIIFLASLLHRVDAAGECFNVETSEGTRTLQDGQRACAPLDVGENLSDIGKRYLICSHGRVYIQSCSGILRYDTVANTCNWPDRSTCSLAGGVSTAPSPPPHVPTESKLTAPPTLKSTWKAQSISTGPITATPAEHISSATKQVTSPAPQTPPPGPCSSQTCKLPNCFCYGSRPNLPLEDTPMFIMLTFDDAVTTTVYNGFFKSLLVDNEYKILNPNGCQIRSAFYVNHQYTEYEFVKSLADKGHEIASHTVNHSLPQGDSISDYPEALAEIVGMRDKVKQGTGDDNIAKNMVGFRAPYLRVAHDIQFDALRDGGFLYDTSIPNIEIYSGRKPLWPFTLDYVMPVCTSLPCPTKPYPGLWQVQINGWIGSNNYSCSMIDVCSVGSNVFTASKEEWYKFYKDNFDLYFYPERVPMHLFTHGSMFLRSPNSYPALVDWFQDLQLTHRNVWIVTPKMVIEWMKNSLTNSQMIAQKWGC